MDLNDLSKNPEQIKGLISLLQGLLAVTEQSTNTKNVETEEAEETDAPRQDVIKTKNQKKFNKSKTANKFERMSEFNMHKEDATLDKALSKHPPVARMRDFEMIDVTCRVCGKKETISPALLFDTPSRYKCNNCSTQAG